MRGITGANDLFEALEVEIPASPKMQNAIDLWTKMYQSNAPWNDEDIPCLGYPAAVAEEIARLVCIEMEVTVSGENDRAKYLTEQLKPFLRACRLKTEVACALGDMVLAPYVKEDGKIGINYMVAGQHWPLEFGDDGQSTAELFIDRKTIGDTEYVRGEIQRFTGDKVEITNKVVKRVNGGNYTKSSLDAVDEWKDLPAAATIENVKQPLWGHFKFPAANKVDMGAPMGVSCFAGAETALQQVDEQWARLIDEYDLGRFRAFVAGTLLNGVDAKGRPLFNVKEKIFEGVPNAGEDLLKEWAPALRDAGYINGMNEILCKIEDLCHLARGTFSDKSEGQALTATQVKILKQRTFTTIQDTQTALQDAIERLVYAMDFYATLYSLSPEGEYELVFDWDDSIITDMDTERQEAWQWVESGNMAFWQYLVNYKGYTEEEAKKVAINAAQVLTDETPTEE